MAGSAAIAVGGALLASSLGKKPQQEQQAAAPVGSAQAPAAGASPASAPLAVETPAQTSGPTAVEAQRTAKRVAGGNSGSRIATGASGLGEMGAASTASKSLLGY